MRFEFLAKKQVLLYYFVMSFKGFLATILAMTVFKQPEYFTTLDCIFRGDWSHFPILSFS